MVSIQRRFPLPVVIGLFSVLMIGSVEGQWNSEESLSATGQYANGGTLFVVTSISSGKRFTLVSSDAAFTNTSTPYRCRFEDENDAAQAMTTIATYIDTSTLQCPFPEWGMVYGSAITSMTLEKDGVAVEVIGDAVRVYFLETITSAVPSSINSGGTNVSITGGGFQLDASSGAYPYYCFLFDPLPSDPFHYQASTTSLYSATPSADQWGLFMPESVTSGTCLVTWPKEAGPTSFSILQIKPDLHSNTDFTFQPVLQEITSAGEYQWTGISFNTTESWDEVRPVLGHIEGGEQITVAGYGFLTAAGSYQCEFDREHLSLPPLVVPASAPSSNTLLCTTPTWSNDTSQEGHAPFRVRRVSDGNSVEENSAFPHIFRFLELAKWSADTPAENSVFVETVNCATLDVNFTAAEGLAPLRLLLEYTPLRPTEREAFATNDVPTVDEILRMTSPLPSVLFDDAVDLDTYLPGGDYQLGNLSFSLQLPYSGTMRPGSKFTKDGAQLAVPDNGAQPSELRLDMETECAPTQVCGRLTWNVSAGWEGHAYRLCVLARPASVSPAATAEDTRFLATRCIFVVVPKCTKCMAPADTLHSVAATYGSPWLSMWSVNPELTNTTLPNPATDEVWNSPADLAYPLVPLGVPLRTGVPYTLRAQDSVYSVGQRFGMALSGLMSLNPDVVQDNQDLPMGGKTVCVLPTASKYYQCPTLAETPNALFFEEVVSYDERGVPIKVANPRYPLPPRSGT